MNKLLKAFTVAMPFALSACTTDINKEEAVCIRTTMNSFKVIDLQYPDQPLFKAENLTLAENATEYQGNATSLSGKTQSFEASVSGPHPTCSVQIDKDGFKWNRYVMKTP